jgi:hypothetical protein
MTKCQKVTPQLYNHNATSAVHRNLCISEDGLRFHFTSNHIDLAANPQSGPAPYLPNFQEVDENAPYAFHDNHIPINSENPDEVSGIKIKVKERAK